MSAIDRILTTHTGSLPRPRHLVRMINDRYTGKPVDIDALERELAAAVKAVVGQQIEVGLDIPSDGEYSKPGFSKYIHERLAGFSEVGSARLIVDDLEDFPGIAERALHTTDSDGSQGTEMFSCVGPIELRDKDAVRQDIARFKTALGGRPPSQAFMGAPTPGQIVFNFPNHFYRSHEDYLGAVAETMRYEYRAITDAGFNLQLDSPDLAMAAHVRTEGSDIDDHAAHSAAAIEALNCAIEGIPEEQLRLHICWGNYGGPHHRDVPWERIFRPILRAKVETFSFEAANPRHAHEWELFRELRLPEGKKIMPGLVDVTTQRIEHPRLVAQRLLQFARLVGRENVVAGTDCGFATVAGWEHVDPGVCWAKLASLVEGASIASNELWSRGDHQTSATSLTVLRKS
jgi:5-methyltetrahydropteroyltriglutamate--homocysteine methyltransferase